MHSFQDTDHVKRLRLKDYLDTYATATTSFDKVVTLYKLVWKISGIQKASPEAVTF